MSDEQTSKPQYVFETVKSAPKAVWRKYQKLALAGKLAIWMLVLFYIAMSAFIIIVSPARIAQRLYDLAQSLSRLPYGWFIMGGIIVLISFPPAIGHTTCLTLCGFAYGMKGFALAAGATIIGAGVVFVILRLLFARRLRAWSSKNAKWMALESVILAKGMPLIILIRMSPFPPWVYSNALFASIQPVKLWQYLVATLFVMPKVALGVFIGSRAAALADGDQRSRMDSHAKALNTAFIVGGFIISTTASIVIYRTMQAHIRQMEISGTAVDPYVDELAAEAVEEAGEGAPLLRNYSDDSLQSQDTVRAQGPVRRLSGSRPQDVEAGQT